MDITRSVSGKVYDSRSFLLAWFLCYSQVMNEFCICYKEKLELETYTEFCSEFQTGEGTCWALLGCLLGADSSPHPPGADSELESSWTSTLGMNFPPSAAYSRVAWMCHTGPVVWGYRNSSQSLMTGYFSPLLPDIITCLLFCADRWFVTCF